MNFEQSFSSESEQPEEKERKHTSKRLLLALETNIKPLVDKIDIQGKENIDAIPAGKKVVIATSHLSDLDIPLTAKVLGEYFDIAISDVSTHHNFREDPQGNVSIRIAGKENFIPIDYKKTDSGKQSVFNPDNFSTMSEAMEEGKDVIVSAHNPSEDGNLTSGGIGAVYLAQLSDAIILPVSVNIKSDENVLVGKNIIKTMTNRPNAHVTIGEPITLEPIEGIEDLKEIFDKRKRKERLSHEEVEKIKKLLETLRAQSEIVMKSIASALPNEKRGEYRTGE